MAPKKRTSKEKEEAGHNLLGAAPSSSSAPSNNGNLYDSDEELNALMAEQTESQRENKRRRRALPHISSSALAVNISVASSQGELPQLDSSPEVDYDDDRIEVIEQLEEPQGHPSEDFKGASIGAKKLTSSMAVSLSSDKIASCTINPHQYGGSKMLLSSYVGTISKEDLSSVAPKFGELSRIFLMGPGSRSGARLLRAFYFTYSSSSKKYSLTHKEAISMMQFVTESTFMAPSLLELPFPTQPNSEEEEERLKQCLRNITIARSLLTCMTLARWNEEHLCTFLCALVRFYLDRRALPVRPDISYMIETVYKSIGEERVEEVMDGFASCLVENEEESGGILMTLTLLCNFKCFDTVRVMITSRWFKKQLGGEAGKEEVSVRGIVEVAALLPRVVRKFKGNATEIYTIMRIVDHCITPSELASIGAKTSILLTMHNHFEVAQMSMGINNTDRDVITATCDAKHLVSMAQRQSKHSIYGRNRYNSDSD